MKKIFAILILLLIMSSNCFASYGSNFAKNFIDEMRPLVEEQIEKATKNIKMNPTNSKAYYKRGVCYNALQKYNFAINDLKNALKYANSTDKNFISDIYENLASSYNGLKDYDSAIGFYNFAIDYSSEKSYSDRANLYEDCSQVFISMNDYTRAIEYMTQSIKITESGDSLSNRATGIYSNSSSYSDRGLLYRKIKNYDLAVKDFEISLKKFPTIGNELDFANILREMGNFDSAIKIFDKLVAKNSNENPAVYYARGMCYKDMKKLEQAKQDFNKAISICDTFISSERADKLLYYNAFYIRAISYVELGENKKAIEDFSKAKSMGEVPNILDTLYRNF